MNLALSKRNDFCKLRIEKPAVLTLPRPRDKLGICDKGEGIVNLAKGLTIYELEF
jgi:hypothetical protein